MSGLQPLFMGHMLLLVSLAFLGVFVNVSLFSIMVILAKLTSRGTLFFGELTAVHRHTS